MVQLCLVIVPPLLIRWHAKDELSLVLLGISRLLRLEKATKLIYMLMNTSDSEVAQQVFQIATSLFINIYVAAGVFMILENFHREE